MPDLSDETRWAISEGSAWPAFVTILGVAHDLERRGATREIRDDAFNGRIVVGVAGLAKASGYSDKAILRQLRHLERVVGIIRTHQETFTTERDPATGRMVRNHHKAPPKVILITIQDHHMRPGPTRRPPAAGVETIPGSKPLGIETTARTDDPRDRNDVVPIDRNLHRGFGHSDRNGRPAAAGHEGRPPRPPQRGQRPATPAAGQDADARAKRDRLVAEYAYHLGDTPQNVIAQWKADPQALRIRLVAAGVDPTTGRRMKGAKAAPVLQVVQETDDTTFQIRRSAAASVSRRDEPPAEPADDFEDRRRDTLRQLQAAAERDLRKAVRKAPKASRRKAAAIGQGGAEAVARASGEAAAG